MAEEGEVGLLAEVSLRPDFEDCILSLVIDECPRENWGLLVPASIQDSSWRRWRWDRKYPFFAGHHQYQSLKKSWAKSDDPINFYEQKCIWSVSGMLLFGRLPWAPGVSKIFFLFGNLLAISCSFIPHTQNNKSKNFFFQKIKFLKNINNWYKFLKIWIS